MKTKCAKAKGTIGESLQFRDVEKAHPVIKTFHLSIQSLTFLHCP